MFKLPKFLGSTSYNFLNFQCVGCQGHKKPQEQKLKERSKSNFQIRNKTRLCDSKTKTQELKTRTCEMQNKNENKYVNMNMKKT